MEVLFQAVNAICGKIQIISNLFWDFPTNFDWYGKIPILGNFSLAIILLVGTGIYFYLPAPLYPGAEIPLRASRPDETEERRHGNFLSHVFSPVNSNACRTRKYLRRYRRNFHRRPGRSFLDVGLLVFRNGNSLRGGDALPDI